MAASFRERFAAPDAKSDDQEIWHSIRTWLVLLRVAIVIMTIFIAELFEEYFILNLSVSVWAVLLGIPAFVVFSVLIIQGDKKLAPEFEARRQASIDGKALKYPIQKRK